MIVFWIIAGLMLIVAIAFVTPSLLRERKTTGVDSNEQNLEIARERIETLNTELKDGTLTEDQFQQAKYEIEQSLADDLLAESSETRNDRSFGAIGLAATGVLVPILTLAIYFSIGSPQQLTAQPVSQMQRHAQQQQSNAGDAPQMSVDEMIQSLAARLEKDPENAEGWFLLGRSYMSMERYADALSAYEKVDKLLPDNIGVKLAMANATAMSQDGKLAGRPAELVQQVLAMEPNNVMALWLAGIGEEEKQNFVKALEYWKLAEPQLEPGSEDQLELRSRMKEAAANAGVQIAFAETVSSGIPVTVALAPELQSVVSPQDTVFVFAKATSGPPMPLAAARFTVSDLPVSVVLDDSMAMMPQMKISGFQQVSISAKISKSGNANAQADDLVSQAVTIETKGAPLVQLTIEKTRQ